MNKILPLLLLFPLIINAQYLPNAKLHTKARVMTDTGMIRGYFVAENDSTIILCRNKFYSDAATINIPVSNINNLKFKDKSVSNFVVGPVAFVFGFILTAGLTKNAGDVDNDGKTSFWELLFTAIEGSTSKNRRRRNTALIVGGAGGITATVICLLANKGFTLTFPIKGRDKFYREKRNSLREYVY